MNNNKLAIGLVIIGVVFAIFLIVNYSSSEHSSSHSESHPSGQLQNAGVANVFNNKQLLLIDKDTDNISIADADVMNDAYVNAGIQAHSTARTAALGAISDMNREISQYKQLIGPGPNTVLGQPKNYNGEELSRDGRGGPIRVGTTSQRDQWGSHGILGDLYRYERMEPNGDSYAAWGADRNTGSGGRWNNRNLNHTADTGRRREPINNCSTTWCDAHARGRLNDAGNHSWHRIHLRSDEELPEWHNSL